MNNTEAKTIVRKCIRALSNTMARNLMEHAANKTPILERSVISHFFRHRGAG